MTRYVADQCYSYVSNQASAVDSALSSIISKYGQVIFTNAVKKTELDGYIDDIKREMIGYSSSLRNATFTPTYF